MLLRLWWSTYHWPSDVNQLDVDDNTNSDFTADVATAVSQWNDVMPGAGPQMDINGGADIEIGDDDGVTPLSHAQNHGFGAIAEALRVGG